MLRTPENTVGGPDDAPQVLRRMLRDKVGPGLRGLGFTGSGKAFALRTAGDSRDHALLGVQSWRYNDAALARFTLNVSFYTAEDWDLAQATANHLGLRPQAKPSPNEEYFCGWSERIGFLYAPGHDHWWAVQNAADAQLVAADVIHVVKTYAVPQLTARLVHKDPPPTFSDSDQSDLRCEWAHCYVNDNDVDDDEGA